MSSNMAVKSQQTVGRFAKQHASKRLQDQFGQQVIAEITFAKYALSDIHKPMGVSEYQLTQSLPDDLKPSLPSVEEIKRELGRGGDG